MKTLIIAVIVLSAAARVEATPIVLFSEGLDGFHADWIGEILPPAGLNFFAIIGECAIPSQCIYNNPVGESALHMFSTVNDIHGTIDGPFGHMSYSPFERQWTTENGADSIQIRLGLYCGVGIDPGCAVPEPSALWLLLAGSLALMWCEFPKRWHAKN